MLPRISVIKEKNKNGKFDVVVLIDNTETGRKFEKYRIQCVMEAGSVVERVSKFDADENSLLKPDSKTSCVLTPGYKFEIVLKGKGKPPKSFVFIPEGGVSPSPTTGPSGGGATGPSGPSINTILTAERPPTTILKLVSIPENSTTDWESNIDYIENIRDGRGYTISIVGFVTKYDFIDVLNEIIKINTNHILVPFIPLVKRVLNTSSVTGLDRLPETMRRVGKKDPVFIEAMWRVIKRLYWKPAQDYCLKNNLKTILSHYIAYDTILNFGEWSGLENIKASNEAEFLKIFLDRKQAILIKDPTLGPGRNNRVDMQRKLLRENNFDLTLPILTSCYGQNFSVE